MKRLKLRPRPPLTDPRETAVYWLAREDEGRLSPDDRAALQDWLDADPAHQAIYDRAREAVGAPGRYSAHPEMMALRHVALSARREGVAPGWRLAAAAALTVIACTAGWAAFGPDTGPSISRFGETVGALAPNLHPNSAVYRTAVGQRSSVRLPDGSIATLNTDSLLRVAYTGGERGVRLLRGQALFEVAHNKRRPFQVYAGDRRITAVGTVFDVRLDREKVKVALVEGVVRVTRLPGDPARRESDAPVQQVVMSAGEVLEATPVSPVTVAAAGAVQATSWRAGVVVFEAAPLSDAVAEVNRYTRSPLTIADPSIAGYRVTGVFKTGDPDRFAHSVAEVLPVEIETSSDGGVVLRGRPEKVSPQG